MAQITIEEAVAQAKRQYLPIPGVVGVGRMNNTIVFYVETEADIGKVPTVYAGYPTTVKVTGPVMVL